MCVDICPVEVFTCDEQKNIASVTHQEDCIGCYSCFYACPSRCIEIADAPLIRPFHRIENDVSFVKQFLQTPVPAALLTSEEIRTASLETGLLITAFSAAISEILGRAHKTVGRRAGTVAAAHLPEMYENKDLDALLKRMQERLGSSFNFTYTISNDDIEISVEQCGLLDSLRKAGQKPGESEVCLLYHEYWAGLVSAFTGARYICETTKAGDNCHLKLIVRRNI
jgi:NAD-dependent dihydropyrimidine dehydrogenase PreA subunit/predicted hydrocarbon binding protein